MTQISKKNSDTSRVIRHKLRKSSEVSNLPAPTEDNFGIASIEEEPLLEVKSSMKEVSRKEKAGNSLNFSGKPSLSNDSRQLNDNFIRNISINIDISDTQDCDQNDIYNDDLGYLTTESLHDFLQDEGNSQEPEEELLKYFKDPVKSEQKEYNDKNISQLRLLLEQNISEEAIGKFRCQSSSFSEEELSKTTQVDLNNYLMSSIQKNLMQPAQKSVFTAALTNNNCKRRVSFENNIPDSFPQSPNIYRKNFSFTPISPRPPTISKSNMNLSPFVFPRDTVFRGKLSTTNFNGNSQTQPAPSPVLQTALVQMSTLKSLSRSTSLSSTPSPVINNCSSSSNNTVLKGRSTPQDTNQEQLESLKYSPLISPSSSSGVFLSPASPMSSCNSPVFSFRKSMSPVKLPDDTKSVAKPTSSLLQSLLLTGKCSEINIPNKNKIRYDTVDESNQIKTEPLAVDVSQFSSQCPTSFRSHSVPTLTSSEAISPKSNTLPFPVSISKNKKLSSLEIKPSELYVWDSVLNGYKRAYDSILTENSFENETMHDGSEIGGNEESMETVISNLCEFLTDNEIARTNATEPLRISRSQPNTPVVYNECSNSSRDPIVSALPLMSASKSYPSTPTACTSQMVDITNLSAKRNIIPLLDNLSIPGPSFSDDIELHLNNLADLSGCGDTFNELAQEVASTTEFKELQ
ncbi:RNA polymerase II proximal promoter sequence-specific DNA binding [Homalodisca vitripennis]|nr:RNA polymerase II proximal promoter sequence-specific DNA binding [Homalodisca vitripennis]